MSALRMRKEIFIVWSLGTFGYVCYSDLFFFFKQKTAYEIKECDWSSDVCSSDLMCMADVTGINAGEGDIVEIFGSKLPVTEICKLAGTIPYDILTGISARVKRNYIRE